MRASRTERSRRRSRPISSRSASSFAISARPGKPTTPTTCTPRPAPGRRSTGAGTFSLSPLASKGDFKFANFTTNQHWAYLRDASGLEVSSGQLGFDGELRFPRRRNGDRTQSDASRDRNRRARRQAERRGHRDRALRQRQDQQYGLRSRKARSGRRKSGTGWRQRPGLAGCQRRDQSAEVGGGCRNARSRGAKLAAPAADESPWTSFGA